MCDGLEASSVTTLRENLLSTLETLYDLRRLDRPPTGYEPGMGLFLRSRKGSQFVALKPACLPLFAYAARTARGQYGRGKSA